MVWTCNSHAQEAEKGGLLAGGQPDLHSVYLKQSRKIEQRGKIYCQGRTKSHAGSWIFQQANRDAMLPTKQIFFLPFVALIIIFLVYHKLISNHKASFVVVLDFCLFRMFFFPWLFLFACMSYHICHHCLGSHEHMWLNSFLWLPGFTGGRRLLFPNSHISVWSVWHVVESTL